MGRTDRLRARTSRTAWSAEDYVRYADRSRFLFDVVRRRFHRQHSIGAFDLFSIVIWKANRAKSRIARRLLDRDKSLERAARRMSKALWNAKTPEDRLILLLREWRFRLPMASAILTVLWPKEFTVYDERVCAELGSRDHASLKHRSSKRSWEGYMAYRLAVERVKPRRFTLRQKDQLLWGRSAAKQLERDIRLRFGIKRNG